MCYEFILKRRYVRFMSTRWWFPGLRQQLILGILMPFTYFIDKEKKTFPVSWTQLYNKKKKLDPLWSSTMYYQSSKWIILKHNFYIKLKTTIHCTVIKHFLRKIIQCALLSFPNREVFFSLWKAALVWYNLLNSRINVHLRRLETLIGSLFLLSFDPRWKLYLLSLEF